MAYVTYSDDYCFCCEVAIKQTDTDHNDHHKLSDNMRNPLLNTVQEATYKDARGVIADNGWEDPEDLIRRSRGHQDESPPSLGCCCLGVVLGAPFWIGLVILCRFANTWIGGG